MNRKEFQVWEKCLYALKHAAENDSDIKHGLLLMAKDRWENELPDSQLMRNLVNGKYGEEFSDHFRYLYEGFMAYYDEDDD